MNSMKAELRIHLTADYVNNKNKSILKRLKGCFSIL